MPYMELLLLAGISIGAVAVTNRIAQSLSRSEIENGLEYYCFSPNDTCPIEAMVTTVPLNVERWISNRDSSVIIANGNRKEYGSLTPCQILQLSYSEHQKPFLLK
jgi:hypothetical protein